MTDDGRHPDSEVRMRFEKGYRLEGNPDEESDPVKLRGEGIDTPAKGSDSLRLQTAGRGDSEILLSGESPISHHELTPFDTGRMSELASEDAATRGVFTRFVSEFLKSVNPSGVYRLDPSTVQMSAQQPHRLLHELSAVTNEIVFMTLSGASRDEMFVEGLRDEPTPLLDLLRTSMSEQFARKFLSYLASNHIVSFTIRTGISIDEFQRFVALMVERKTRQEQGQSVEASFSKMLADNDLLHISVLTMDEVVSSRPNIPWRVKLALSRLRKDLAVIPFEDLETVSDLQEARQSLVADIVRPLKLPRFLRELLVNIDLIRESILEFCDIELESEILNALSAETLDGLCRDLISNLDRVSWGPISQLEGEEERRIDVIMQEVLVKAAIRLMDLDTTRSDDVIQLLLEKRLIHFRDLSPRFQKVLLTGRWTDQFMQNQDSFFERLSSATDIEDYRKMLATIEIVLPELVRRGRVGHISTLVSTIAWHADDDSVPQRMPLAATTIERLATGELLDFLKGQIESGDRTERMAAIETLQTLRHPGISVLLGALGQSEVAAVRRDILTGLEKAQKLLCPHVQEILNTANQPWYLYRNILVLLSRIDARDSIPDIRKFVSFLHPKVREQALMTLHALGDTESEAILIRALSDQDTQVTRRAFMLLGDAGSTHPLFLKMLAELFAPHPGKGWDDETLRLSALRVIQDIGQFETPDGIDIADFLLGFVPRRGPTLLQLILRRRPDSTTDAVRLAICRTLGAIGDARIARELSKISEKDRSAIGQAAAEAASVIRRRLAQKI